MGQGSDRRGSILGKEQIHQEATEVDFQLK